MGEHATIERCGHVSIDTTAWLEQRTVGVDPDLTRDLLTWAGALARLTHVRPELRDLVEYRREWETITRDWCTARGHLLPEPHFVAHAGNRLDADVWILRATVTDRYRVAVVGANHDLPSVRAEAASLDPWAWFDADSVDIRCPAAHCWTWRTGRELVTSDGAFTTLSVVFGLSLDAPFVTCQYCSAHQLGRRRQPCGCNGEPWIVCPICGARCDVELPSPRRSVPPSPDA